MKKVLAILAFAALLNSPAFAQEEKPKEQKMEAKSDARVNHSEEKKRLEEAGNVMREVLQNPEDLPKEILDQAECVIVVPDSKKFAFIVGGSYGRGTMTCRSGDNFQGNWTAPSMVALEGASVGFQIGGKETDLVLLVMNKKGADSILGGSTVKLGADIAAAAGPKGRSAEASTDAAMRAEILSYSRASGLFAGVSVEGSTLRIDRDANKKIYGERYNAREIIKQGQPDMVPQGARELLAVLNQNSPANRSDAVGAQKQPEDKKPPQQ